MKGEEFRKLTRAELEDKIRSLREEIFNLEFRLSTQRLDNPLRIRLLRRDVARGMTALREMELKGKAEAGSAAGPVPGPAADRPEGATRS